MPVLFSKLKSDQQSRTDGQVSEQAASYQLTCDCGASVSGTRRTTWIEAECSECFQSLFVLPTNVYPTTPSVPGVKVREAIGVRLRQFSTDLLSRLKRRPEAEAVAVPGRSWKFRLPKLTLPQLNLREKLRRTFTPFRILMLSMAGVLVMTLMWMQRQSDLEQSQQIWLQSSDQIDELLADSELLELEPVLEHAVAAGRVLGKDDVQWRRLTNLLAETHAVNNVSDGNLISAFHQVYDPQGRLLPGAQSTLETAGGSGFVVLDSYVRPGRDSGTYFIELPATPGKHAVELQLQLSALGRYLAGSDGKRMIFAARIQQIDAPQTDRDRSWKIRLAAESFVLLTQVQHCNDLGLSVQDDPDLEEVLKDQRDFVESSQEWNHR